MSNKTYWNDRDKARFEYIRQNLADDKAFNASLEKYYQRTIDAINKDIQSELQSFAARDGVSLAEARKKVSKTDIRQFEAEAKKVVKEADQMRKKGKRVGYADFSDEVNERMRLYNVTMRINRLEYLKSIIGVRLIELGVDINAELNVKLDEDTRNEFERQSGILAGAGMADAMNWWTEENVQKIIMSSTRSASFSTRIWSNIDVLKSELEKQLSRVLISGENPKATAEEFYKHITKGVGNMRAAAERIARTESARCQTQATLESFKEYGVKYCRWIAEPRACDICKEIASRSSGYGRGVYPVKDVPTLPQHPNCRCALSAHWIDEKDRAEASRLERKKNTEKRVTINKEKQRKLTAEFRKNGGKVWQGSEAEHYLKSRGAAAMTLGDATIVLQNKPTISEVLEELYHIEQFKNGEIDDDISKYKAEIEAQNYLLSVEKMYNIPRREIEETKRNLNYWKGKLENENK